MTRIGLNIASIRLPDQPAFPEQVQALVTTCNLLKNLQKRPSAKAEHDRFLHCHTLIEGLYQVWATLSNKAGLNTPLSPQFYHSKDYDKINHLSYYYLQEGVAALVSLGWVEVVKGAKLPSGEKVVTQIKPAGDLLATFEQASIRWSPLAAHKEVIVLRGYDRDHKERYRVRVPQTSTVRKMAANTRKINEHLRHQAICLHLSNDHLKQLTVRMAEGKYRSQWHTFEPEKHGRLLNFNHVTLRRIFSRENMERGGRFYGGWWQFIPSEYRPYITINGLATVEVDFSELHPRLLYLSQQLDPPQGDLYDVGLRIDGTDYDPSIEPYKTQRSIVKEVFNALLNDETGRYRPSPSKLKALGVSYSKLKKLILKRHPPLKAVLGTGIGLYFQYLDSQIAEKVMLRLLEKNITCLPVHDSFVVPRHQGHELISAMNEAFASMHGHAAKLKDPSDFKSDFRLIFKDDKVDLPSMFARSEDSIHDRYVRSRLATLGADKSTKRQPRPVVSI